MNNYFYRTIHFGDFVRITKVFILLFIITIISDAVNIPTKVLENYGSASLIVILFAFIVIAIIFSVENHFFDIIKTKTVNEFDSILINTILYDLLYLVFLWIKPLYHFYKLIGLVAILAISVIILICRIRYNNKRCYKPSSNTKGNIYDFKDFLEKEIDPTPELPILFAEEEVDYDLFNRDVLINQLYYSILACCGSKYSFVIGLEGPWGCGKTTIVKNVSNRIKHNCSENIIVTNDFDPWIYSTQEALLTSLFDIILRKTGIKYSKSSLKNLSNNLVKNILGSHFAGKVASEIVLDSGNENIIKSLKLQIHNYLEQNNKSLVIFIDNLDRASAGNIVFLLKIISNVFDLDRIIYVLSYDENRINAILDKNQNINKNYIEKIVQQVIKVTKLNKNKFKSIIGDCLQKLLNINSVHTVNTSDYEYIIDFLADYCEDLRAFKRMINSIGFMLSIDNELYKPDLLSLEIIRFFHNDLYEEIHNNSKYYIYTDQDTDAILYGEIFNRDTFNKNAKSYFDDLIKKYDVSLMKLIARMFPYVDRAIKGTEIRPETDGQYEEYSKDIVLNCRVASAKYFDNYFYHDQKENEYIVVAQIYNKFIDTIYNELSKGTEENIPGIFDALFEKIPVYYHLEIISKLWYARNDFDEKICTPIIVGLINNSNTIDNERGFFTLSAYQRATAIVATLFTKINENDKKDLINYLRGKYHLIEICDEILYWLDSSSFMEEASSIDVQLFEELLFDMYNQIINTPINILEKDNYERHNLWALLRIKRRLLRLDKDEKVDIKDYISTVLQPEHIYVFLKNVIGTSSGSHGYEYYFSDDTFECFFDNNNIIKTIDSFINLHPPKDDIELFLSEVYEIYKNGEKDIWGHKSYKSDHFIRL